MPDELWAAARVDGRSVGTNAADPEMLAEIVDRWTIPSEMPKGVARLWERAVAQFRSGSFAYENFTDSARSGFEAVDAALRNHIADVLKAGERLTFGPLIQRAHQHGRLTPWQYEWLSVYALHFRNKLTHADGSEPTVITPPMARDMLEGIGRFLSDLIDSDAA